jgi:hypothetical protein
MKSKDKGSPSTNQSGENNKMKIKGDLIMLLLILVLLIFGLWNKAENTKREKEKSKVYLKVNEEKLPIDITRQDIVIKNSTGIYLLKKVISTKYNYKEYDLYKQQKWLVRYNESFS